MHVTTQTFWIDMSPQFFKNHINKFARQIRGDYRKKSAILVKAFNIISLCFVLVLSLENSAVAASDNIPAFCKKLNVMSTHAKFPKYPLPSNETPSSPKNIPNLKGQFLPPHTPPMNGSPEAVVILWIALPNCGASIYKDNVQSIQFNYLTSHQTWAPLRLIPISLFGVYGSGSPWGPAAWTISWKAGLPINHFNYDLPDGPLQFRAQYVNSLGAGPWSNNISVPQT